MNTWQWAVFVILWGGSAAIIWMNVYGIVGSISSRKNLYFAFGLGFVATIAGPLTFVGGAVLRIAAAGWQRHKELKEDERRNSGPKCVECGHPAGMHRVGTGLDSLQSFTIPANTLVNNGDYLEVVYGGTFVANSGRGR